MKYATEVKDGMNYFVLLRALFRSIGGGKFDLFFKEFLPLLPGLKVAFFVDFAGLLEGLNRLQNSCHPSTLRDLFVELSLTVPVRLSALLPCLRILMKPLLLALEATTELIIQGLRTLESYIDNLPAEFLDPVLEEVKPEVMWSYYFYRKVNAYCLETLKTVTLPSWPTSLENSWETSGTKSRLSPYPVTTGELRRFCY